MLLICISSHLHVLSLSFYNPPIKFVLPIYSWMQGHPLGHARPTIIMETVSLPKKSPTASSCSMLKCWLAWSGAGAVQATTRAVGSWMHHTVMFRGHCSIQSFLMYGSCSLSTPFSTFVTFVDMVWYTCSIYLWALHGHLFSTLWLVVSFYVDCIQLHKETLIWSKSSVKIWVYRHGLEGTLILHQFSKKNVVVGSPLGPVRPSAIWCWLDLQYQVCISAWGATLKTN